MLIFSPHLPQTTSTDIKKNISNEYKNQKSKLLNEVIDNYLGNLDPIIHLLPLICSTRDGGFAVSSFENIDPQF